MLAMAERCGLAPALAEQYPETGDAAERGTAIHAEIVRAWRENDQAPYPEAQAACDWLRSLGIDAELYWEKQVAVVDDLDVLTEGTPDLVIEEAAICTVVDWKTGRSENVEDADSNLQLIAYGLAICGGEAFRCVLVFLDGLHADARYSRVFEPAEHPALLSRVRAAATRKPEAHPGEWCGSCYQRRFCPSYRVRESQALALIESDVELGITDGNAGQIMARAKAVREAAETAEAMVKAHVRNGGACIVDGKRLTLGTCKGRESADVKALKEAGLVQYIKEGAPYERAAWKKEGK